jgi:cell division protein FtsL
MAAWTSNAAIAAPVPARTARPRPKRAAAASRRPALLGSVTWIAVLAALLAGVVALNVAALQLNVQRDRLAERKAELRAENALLSAKLSSAASAPQVAALARTRLGLAPATPEQTTYVDLARRE